ncbi:MAG: arcadin 1 [Nitrososphaerota archaeon]|nr:arcadin 1 [Candidatus Bathyarchaeota archaeon]MDW8049023.1 arcadin 1 [Nitrososphaerota archaeon]
MRVTVQRIESIRDQGGNLGKRIELVEENVMPTFAIRPPSEEAQVVQEVFRVLQQQLPMLGMQAKFSNPKIILFLTEEEYEELGVRFDVNQVYDVILEDGSIKFRKVT